MVESEKTLALPAEEGFLIPGLDKSQARVKNALQ